MRILLRDIVHAARLLRRTPYFTLLAATTLALGIGANAAIFSVVNAVLLTPLPFPNQQQIVQIWDATRSGSALQLPLSLPKFDLYRGENTTFEYIAAYSATDFQTGSGGASAAEELHGAHVTAGLFQVLGIGPAFGRLFLADEDLPAGGPVVIIGHGLWQRRFGSDPEILGKSIEVDGTRLAIVGVMPARFDFPNESEIWVPKVFEHSAITRRQIEGGAGYLSVLARLKPGVAVEKAAAELDTISGRYSAAHTDNLDAGHGADVVPLREELIHSVRPTLLMLFGAVGLLLLIACSNVANLFLARAAERRRETAIRAALGASRWRLIRQLLTESVLISLAGSALGLLLASWAVGLIGTVTATILPHGSIIQIDLRVTGFTVLLACLTGVLFGIAPSWQASKIDLNRALRDSGKGSGASRESSRLRSLMLGAQIALALVLLAGAGLLMQSLVRLQAVDPGFRPQGLLTAHVSLPPGRYPEKSAQASFYTALLDGIAQTPGVASAAATSALPFSGGGIAYFFQIDGRPSLGPSKDPVTRLRIVSADYFRTMGIPLRNGRPFGEDDNENGPLAAIINENMARHYWPGENPIGKKITYSREHIRVEITGVAGDVKFNSLGDIPTDEMYVPYRQRPTLGMSLVVRTTADPSTLASAVRGQVFMLDKDQPVTSIRTMDNVVSGSLSESRLRGLLVGTFAMLALVLAAIGIFGVVAYTVAQRTSEIGIRLALGAARSHVTRLVLRQTLVPVLFGIAVGWVVAILAARLISSMLFGLNSMDIMTLSAATGTLLLVAGIAACIPVLRASRTDPLAALREE